MKHQTKAIFGGLMGNVVEAYDIAILYYLSTSINTHIMGLKENRPTFILLIVFLAYLAKPIGAVILGIMSDKYGRKNVLAGSVFLVGLSTFAMGLIPSHASIGYVAAGLLLALRLMQSMAVGAEFLNSASFLVESGNPKNRGFLGCWSSAGVKLGYVLACIVVEVIRQNFATQANADWIWRVPFFLVLVTTCVAFFVRYSMPESLAYVLYYADRKKPTTKKLLSMSWHYAKSKPFLCHYAFFASFLAVGSGFFFYLYIPMHLGAHSGLGTDLILRATGIASLAVSCLIPVFAWLSDRFDRLFMLMLACIGFIVIAYPFMQAANSGSYQQLLTMQLLASIPCGCYLGVSTVIMTELFPLNIRCTVLSVLFAVSASLASGLPPLLADWLSTFNPNYPAIIIIVLPMIVLANAMYLARHYRMGRNEYDIKGLQDEREVSELNYTSA